MKYLKNTSWLMGEKILRMTVGLLVGVWVARYLGPEQFGLFSYAISFVGLFAALATLGLDGIVIRELVKDDSKKGKLIATAFYLKLIGACLVLGILAIAVNFTSNDYYTNVLVFIIASSTIFQSFNVIDFYFQAKVLSKYVVYVNMIGLFLSSIIKIVLILNEASLMMFVWVVLFDSFVLALGLVYFFIKVKVCHIQQLSFNKGVATSLLKDCWPLILSGVIISIYMKIDQVMIKEMLGSEDVGQYAVAVRLSELWYFVPTIIVTSIFPSIVNSLENDENIFYKRIQTLYNFFFILSLSVAVIGSGWSHEIVLLIFGKQYLPASDILTVYIWASIFVFHGCIRGQYLIALNKQVIGLHFRLVGVVVNVCLNYILIQRYGVIGAAYATVISFALPVYLLALRHEVLRRDLLFTWKAYMFLWVFKK